MDEYIDAKEKEQSMKNWKKDGNFPTQEAFFNTISSLNDDEKSITRCLKEEKKKKFHLSFKTSEHRKPVKNGHIVAIGPNKRASTVRRAMC